MNSLSSPIIRTIIADDHQLFADGLEHILNNHTGFEIIAKASDGRSLLHLLNSKNADLILMDIHMPMLNGLDTAALLRKRFPAIKIVFLSMRYDPVIKTLIEKNGISGYISKTITAARLIESLRSVMAGKIVFDLPADHHSIAEKTAGSEDELFRVYKITKTELEIIQLIASGKSTKIIAAEKGLSELTIQTQRRNILRKLHARNTGEVVAFAIRHNLIK